MNHRFGLIGIVYSTLVVYLVGSILISFLTYTTMRRQGYLGYGERLQEFQIPAWPSCRDRACGRQVFASPVSAAFIKRRRAVLYLPVYQLQA